MEAPPENPDDAQRDKESPGRAGAFDTFCMIASPYASSQLDIAATAGLQVACLRLACDWRDIDEREPARGPE
jgi:hypothetical protein